MSGRKIRAVELAHTYIEQHATDARGVLLRRWRDDWYVWSPRRGCYGAITEEQLDSRLYQTLELRRRSDVSDVRHALLAVPGVLIDEVEIGAWLDGEAGHDRRDVVATTSGILHLPTGELAPATPSYFVVAALGVAYDPSAPPPTKWLAFLRALWGDDDESIAALQEWLGYLLSPDTRLHKILLLVGPARSGKGTIMRVVVALLGATSVASPTLASLSSNFGLWPLIGKTAAIVGDARLGGRADIAQIVERLLSISGEDSQTIDRKHREPWTGTLTTRCMLVSNELLRLTDASDALAKRMLALRLTRSWYGTEDETLSEQLIGELPGILAWAVEGWRRLRERRRFAQPSSSAAMINELVDLGSPVAAWVRVHLDRDVADRDRWISCTDAYQDFRRWCDCEGLRVIPTQTIFGRDLRTATGADRVLITRRAQRIHVYSGLAARSAPAEVVSPAPADAPISATTLWREIAERESGRIAGRQAICPRCKADLAPGHEHQCPRAPEARP